MNINRIHLSLATALAAVSMLSAPLPAAAETHTDTGTQWKCGFYLTPNDPERTTARYQHCGKHHIMIRTHWSNGASGLQCINPWENVPFWRSGFVVITDAYYVPIKPWVGGNYCLASQPED